MKLKRVNSAVKRGHKFIQDSMKSVANADALARKAHNTLHNTRNIPNGYSNGGWARR